MWSFVTGFFILAWWRQGSSMYQCFIPFCYWTIFHWMDRAHFVYVSVNIWVISTFCLLWRMLWTFICKFLWIYIFCSFGYVGRSGIVGSYGISMFNFSKWPHHFTFPPAFMRVVIYQYLLSVFLILATLVCVKRYLMILSCVSVMTSDVEHLFMRSLAHDYLSFGGLPIKVEM